jgi:hypothetical protein
MSGWPPEPLSRLAGPQPLAFSTVHHHRSMPQDLLRGFLTFTVSYLSKSRLIQHRLIIPRRHYLSSTETGGGLFAPAIPLAAPAVMPARRQFVPAPGRSKSMADTHACQEAPVRLKLGLPPTGATDPRPDKRRATGPHIPGGSIQVVYQSARVLSRNSRKEKELSSGSRPAKSTDGVRKPPGSHRRRIQRRILKRVCPRAFRPCGRARRPPRRAPPPPRPAAPPPAGGAGIAPCKGKRSPYGGFPLLNLPADGDTKYTLLGRPGKPLGRAARFMGTWEGEGPVERALLT